MRSLNARKRRRNGPGKRERIRKKEREGEREGKNATPSGEKDIRVPRFRFKIERFYLGDNFGVR